MARRPSGRFSGSRRRPTNWIDLVQDEDNILAIAADVLGRPAAVATTDNVLAGNSTLIRIRGFFGFTYVPQAGAFTSKLSFGIALISDKLAAQAATAHVDSSTDPGWDGWMWLGYRFVTNQSVADMASVLTVDPQVEIDSKAMRKWDDEQTIVFMAKHTAIAGTPPSISVYVTARGLVKGP